MVLGRREGGAWRWAGLLLLVCSLSLPFIDKAFHIDDTFFLRISSNIIADPLDPFAGVIDWTGVRRPVWDLASNPPFLSYYLAPFLALAGDSELFLHAAMIPFLLLLAVGTHSLALRFTSSAWLATGLVMTSTGVLVSTNLMRDVPATALGVAAIAAVVAATDRDKPILLYSGFALAGLALLTRFNSVVFVGAALLYPLCVGRLRSAWAALIPLAALGLWSLHNLAVYGEPQLLAQLGRGHNRPFHAWRENLAAVFVIAGSLLYLAPALLLKALLRRDRIVLLVLLLSCALTWAGLQLYLRGLMDAQYLFWSLLGCVVLCVASIEGLRPSPPGVRRNAKSWDSQFLLAWLFLQLLLGVLVAPYPAVRHLLPALVPLSLLCLRYWEGAPRPEARWLRAAPALCLLVQAATAFAVASADRDLANSYRDFARQVAEQDSSWPGDTWFVGHWGWMYYAQRSGLRQLHGAGPAPAVGDRLIVPVQVDKGVAPLMRAEVRGRLRKLGQREYPGSTPLRTVHASGAGFYALFNGRNTGRTPDVPYRWLPSSSVELFEVFEVGDAASAE